MVNKTEFRASRSVFEGVSTGFIQVYKKHVVGCMYKYSRKRHVIFNREDEIDSKGATDVITRGNAYTF